jgi:hypothetical protein
VCLGEAEGEYATLLRVWPVDRRVGSPRNQTRTRKPRTRGRHAIVMAACMDLVIGEMATKGATGCP